jgi:membrane protein implicated in regulation of membrane protease activity
LGFIMRIGKILLYFGTVFLIAFLVTAVVTALYGRIVHGACGLNWENAIIFGLIFGAILTWTEVRRMDRDEDEDDNPYD